jgi:hypothetical protein
MKNAPLTSGYNGLVGGSSPLDALEFPNGQIVLLNRLCEGQHVTVLQLPASPRTMHKGEVQKRATIA